MKRIKFSHRGDNIGGLAKKSEDVAVAVLRKRQYRILETNFRISIGEVDIIAAKNDVVWFIEVRSTKGIDKELSPEMRINRLKIQKMIRVGQYFVQSSRMEYKDLRVLLIAVSWYNPKRANVRFIDIDL